jgi:ParB-like chromosome segregation protein Spo0J
MKIQLFPIEELKAYDNNPRRIPEEAVKAVSNSIREFGFKVPVIIDKDNVIVAGHTRVLAARELGMHEVPCIVADDLTPDQIRAFRLVDNKTAELTGWDFEKLDLELEELSLDMSSFGFELAGEEVDTGAFFTEAETVERPQKTNTP